MIGLTDFQTIMADTFFDGSTAIAGILMYAVVLMLVFVFLKKNLFTALLVSLPLTLVFSMLGIIGTDMMVLMIIIAALGLAMTAQKTIG